MTSQTTAPGGGDVDGPAETPRVMVSRRVSAATGLMLGAAAGVVAAVVVLGRGGALPVIVGVSAPEPVAWTKLLALPVAVLAVVWLLLLVPRVTLWARLLAVASSVGFLVVSGWFAWRGMPEPGPEFGLGGRVPWILVGCAVGGVAALVYAAGAAVVHRARPGSLGWVVTLVVAAVVTLVLVAGTLVGVRGADNWTAAQNLDVAGADGPLKRQRASTLDGSTRWQVESSREVAETAGGLVTVTGPGVYAIDPTTGKQRWHYFNWGSSFEGPVVTSPDGRYIAVTAGLDSSVDQFLSGGSSSSAVYVFDAQRGRLRARIDAHGGQPRYVDGDTVVVDEGSEAQDTVRAYRYDGSKAWAFTPDGDCSLAAVVGLEDGVLVGYNCGDGAEVSVRESRTGRERWGWEHDGYLSPNGIVVGNHGTVVLDLPGEYQDEGYDGNEPGRDAHTVTALDAATGKARWSRDGLHLGSVEPGDAHYSHTGLYAAGTLVLAGSRYSSLTRPVELVGLDPGTGNERWRRQVALDDIHLPDRTLPDAEHGGLLDVVRRVGDRVVLAGSTSVTDRPETIQVRAVSAHHGKNVSSATVPSPTDVGDLAVYAVGETVTVRATRLSIGGSETHLVSLG